MIGNLVSYLRDPLEFLTSMHERYGDVVSVALGPLKSVLLHDPSHVEDILVRTPEQALEEGSASRWRRSRPVLGNGLLTSDGDFWRRQRRLAQPAFHRDRIAGYGKTMVSAASRLAASWRDGETRDVHKDMMRLTLEIVADTLFGAQVGEHAEDVGEALESVLAVASDPLYLFFPALKELPVPGRPRYGDAVARLDKIIYGIIEKRRASGQASADLLSMLLHAEDEDGSRMSDRQLRDECMTLFLAGHETTALALSFAWLLLAQNPRAEVELARELDAVLGDRVPTLADLPRLRVASNVIAETLRLYPPAWSLGREAVEDVVVGDATSCRAGRRSGSRRGRFSEIRAGSIGRTTSSPSGGTAAISARSLHKYVLLPRSAAVRASASGKRSRRWRPCFSLATVARSFRVRRVVAPSRVALDVHR